MTKSGEMAGRGCQASSFVTKERRKMRNEKKLIDYGIGGEAGTEALIHAIFRLRGD